MASSSKLAKLKEAAAKKKASGAKPPTAEAKAPEKAPVAKAPQPEAKKPEAKKAEPEPQKPSKEEKAVPARAASGKSPVAPIEPQPSKAPRKQATPIASPAAAPAYSPPAPERPVEWKPDPSLKKTINPALREAILAQVEALNKAGGLSAQLDARKAKKPQPEK